MDEKVQIQGKGAAARQNAAALCADATRWVVIVAPFAIIAGPSPGDIAASLAAILFLAHSALARRWFWLRQPWVIAALALWSYSCLRSMLVPYPAAALGTALPFIRFPIFAAGLQCLVLRDAKTRTHFIWAASAALSGLALDGLLQFLTGFDIVGRPRWGFRLLAFYHHAWVGAVIAWLFLPVALGLFDAGKRWLALGGGVLWFTIVLLSGDRMALLCALAQLVILALCTRRARRVFLIGLPIVAVGVGAILYVAPSIYDRQVKQTASSIRGFGESQYAALWTSAWKIARAHPLFGVGSKGFEKVCPDPNLGPIYPFKSGEARCAPHPHNTYLEWLDDGGLVGLGLFLLTMGYIITALLPLVRNHALGWSAAGLFATLLARLWPLASWTSFHHAWSAVPFWLVVGWGLALAQGKDA